MEYIPIERTLDSFQQPVPLDTIVEMCKRAFGSQEGMHIGGALVEGQRLGRKDTLERGYKDLKNTVAQLQMLVQ